MTRWTTLATAAALAVGFALLRMPARAETGNANCAVITQAAAAGIAARIQADDRDIQAPQSLSSLTCLDNFFSGSGLNVITNVLDPATLLNAVKGQICSAVRSSWTSAIGSAQCGLTLSGFDLGFGGLGGGSFCPKLSFGGGGPTWGTLGVGGSGGGLLLNGASVGPSNYPLPPNAGAY